MRGFAGAIALMAFLALLLASAGTAAAPEVCSDTPKQPTSFCGTYDYALTPAIATKPFNIAASFADTSTGLGTDQNTWPKLAELTSVTAGVAPPLFTASKKLPDALLIAGGGPCTAPTFTDCGAGHGAFYANVSGTYGLFDGIHQGTFGIRSIENVQDPASYLHYKVNFEFCLPFSGNSCFVDQTDSEDFSTGAGRGSRPPTLSLPLSQTFDYSYGYGTAHIDGAVTSLTGLTLHGSSNTLAGGTTTPKTYIAARLANACGTASAKGRFTSFDDRSVTTPATVKVTGCTRSTVRTAERTKLRVRGTVKSTVKNDPPVSSGKAHVVLSRKRKHRYSPLSSAKTSIDSRGRYKAAFPKPRPGSCRVITRYGGDAEHAPSKASKKFAC
jgi:hypothetical protein